MSTVAQAIEYGKLAEVISRLNSAIKKKSINVTARFNDGGKVELSPEFKSVFWIGGPYTRGPTGLRLNFDGHDFFSFKLHDEPTIHWESDQSIILTNGWDGTDKRQVDQLTIEIVN